MCVQCQQRKEESVRSSGIIAKDGAGNQICVLWKNSLCLTAKSSSLQLIY